MTAVMVGALYFRWRRWSAYRFVDGPLSVEVTYDLFSVYLNSILRTCHALLPYV